MERIHTILIHSSTLKALLSQLVNYRSLMAIKNYDSFFWTSLEKLKHLSQVGFNVPSVQQFVHLTLFVEV